MTANQTDIEKALAEHGGAVSRRANPGLRGSIAWLVRTGRLRPALPGVYIQADLPDPVPARMAAVPLWNPDAVLVGTSAASLTFWPDIDHTVVEVAVPTGHTRAPGYRISRRRLKEPLYAEEGGVRCATAAAAALDLCLTRGGEAIDRVLRSRQATLRDLTAAMELMGGRRGNGERRALLLDSQDSPWSAAERDVHRLLREAGITGWVANYRVERLIGGYYIDVAFPALKLAIEVDGRQFHISPAAFESDRWRQNDLVLAGWTVLRFTYAMVRDTPGVVVAYIRRALGQ